MHDQELNFAFDPDSSSRTAILSYFRSEIRFETELVTARLNALLSSQSFLIIAFATVISTSGAQWGKSIALLLAAAMALLGFTLAVSAAPGIRAAYVAIGRWEAREQRLHEQCASLSMFNLANVDMELKDVARRSRQGAMFARRAPASFMAAWIAFLALAGYLALR